MAFFTCSNPFMEIREAMNTYNPCLSVLVSKGYRVSADFPEDGAADWCVENDHIRISATSPIALLGLIALWENRGDAWRKRSHEPNLYDQILDGKSIP
jgi:hypothetical protein